MWEQFCFICVDQWFVGVFCQIHVSKFSGVPSVYLPLLTSWPCLEKRTEPLSKKATDEMPSCNSTISDTVTEMQMQTFIKKTNPYLKADPLRLAIFAHQSVWVDLLKYILSSWKYFNLQNFTAIHANTHLWTFILLSVLPHWFVFVCSRKWPQT